MDGFCRVWWIIILCSRGPLSRLRHPPPSDSSLSPLSRIPLLSSLLCSLTPPSPHPFWRWQVKNGRRDGQQLPWNIDLHVVVINCAMMSGKWGRVHRPRAWARDVGGADGMGGTRGVNDVGEGGGSAQRRWAFNPCDMHESRNCYYFFNVGILHLFRWFLRMKRCLFIHNQKKINNVYPKRKARPLAIFDWVNLRPREVLLISH